MKNTQYKVVRNNHWYPRFDEWWKHNEMYDWFESPNEPQMRKKATEWKREADLICEVLEALIEAAPQLKSVLEGYVWGIRLMGTAKCVEAPHITAEGKDVSKWFVPHI